MKRSVARGLRVFLLLLAVLSVTGCESVTVAAVEIVVVRVSPLQVVIFVDETEQLSASAEDASGNRLSGRTITWSSSNPATASVSASGLVRALSAGAVTIRATAEGVTGSSSITVILRPQIVLAASQVQFESEFAGEPTESVQIGITNGAEGTLSGLQVGTSYQPGEPQGWVEADLSPTTAPATLTIRVLPATLPAGIHEAEVQVRSSVAGNSPQSVRVILQVAEAPPSVAVSPGVVSFASDAGQADPPPQTVAVTNGGGGDLHGIQAVIEYDPGSGSGWLSATLDGTSAPAQLTISADPQGLAPGVYDAVITVTSTSAPGFAAQVSVRFRFGSPPPEIELVPLTLELEVLEVTPAISPQVIIVGNRGTGTLGNLVAAVDYPAGGPTGWLQAFLDSDTAPTSLQLLPTVGGLLPGEYTAEVEVSSIDAVNSSQTMEFVLRVLPRPSVALSTITPVPPSITADGTSTSTIEVQLNDLRGVPIPTGRHVVTLSATVGTLGAVANNGDGAYTTILTSTMLAQQSTVTGTVDMLPLLDAAMVDFVPGPPDPAMSTIDAAPVTITADGAETSTVTVQLVDVNGNLLTVGGDAVVISTDLGSVTGTSDNGDGTYTATLTSTTTGAASLTATVGGAGIVDNATVTLNPGPPSTATSQVTPSPTAITSDGLTSSTITVQLQDANSNNLTVGGDAVVISTDVGSVTATNDNGDGTYTATLTSTSPGTATLTATLGGVGIADNATVTINVGAPTTADSEVTAAPTTITTDAGSSSIVTVQLRDGGNNDLTTGGDAVAILTNPGSVTGMSDNGDGTYTAMLTSTSPGTATVTATLGGAGITDDATVTVDVGAPSPATSQVTASPTTITTDLGSTSIVTVQLRDTNSNNLVTGGDAVVISTNLSSVTATTDNANGSYTATLTSTTPGTATVTATLGGAGITRRRDGNGQRGRGIHGNEPGHCVPDHDFV